MNKIQVTEMMFDCVFKCMQIVGVNSLEAKNGFGKLLREASVLPIYDGGIWVCNVAVCTAFLIAGLWDARGPVPGAGGSSRTVI